MESKYKHITSEQIATAMASKLFMKMEELKLKPKLSPEETRELKRLRDTLSVVKQTKVKTL